MSVCNRKLTVSSRSRIQSLIIQYFLIMITINEWFVCIGCAQQIPPASKTCRNHCPHCFTSLHVDGDIPGDRNTDCHGVMKPIAFDFKMSGWSKILFRCETCHKEHRNRVAEDDNISMLTIKQMQILH